MSKRGDLYSQLFNSFRKCYPLIKPGEAQRQVNEEWSKAKTQYKSPQFEVFIESLIKKYLEEATKKKSKSILNFFKTTTTAVTDYMKPAIINSTTDQPSSSALVLSSDSIPSIETTNINEKPGMTIATVSTTFCDNNNNSTNCKIPEITTIQQKKYATPSQVQSKEKLAILNSELHSKELKRDSGLAEISIQKDINNLRNEITREHKSLKKKESNANRQKKFRSLQKLKLKKAAEIPGVEEVLKLQKTPGRPKIERNQSDLLKTILDIATFSGGADPKRRTEVVHCVRTLNELHERLLELGFTLSRSATYLRLLPRNSTTIEGRRHLNTVPVKLSRARADSHKKHPDGQFAASTIRSLEEIASLLGPGQVGWISQDDKNKVPLGLPAANKQTPLLMHIEYRVTLPDHDWVVASRHKLTPSVYAGIKIEPQGLGRPEAVGYSGPTYIAVRSGKHSSSTAASHSEDFDTLINLDIFKDFLKTSDNQVKPVLIFSVDGGPDENPRYQKTINFAVQHFKNYNLDALFIVTNAPGRSAYNRVERRMAPLSKQLSGLILEHDHFGSHLDGNGKTIDEDLELQNFEHAGQLLAQIWSEMVIDGYQVFSEYKSNKATSQVSPKIDQHWYSTHVRESQYFLQICKCNNLDCCGKVRSDIGCFLKERFLPPPYPLFQSDEGSLTIPLPNSEQSIKFAPLLIRLAASMTPKHKYQKMPFDLYCPSLLGDINERICDQCGIYFATKSSLTTHHKIHGRKRRTTKIKPKKITAHREDEILCILDSKTEFDDLQWLPTDDVDTQDVPQEVETETVKAVELIENMAEWLAGPWSEDVSL